MLMLPFLIFWALIFLAREELGVKGVAISVAVWLALLVGFSTIGALAVVFVAAQAALDIFLILKVFGGDISI